MNLTLVNTYTDEEITVKNVTAYVVKDCGTRVYTEQNGCNDMTTYMHYFPPMTIADELRGLF